MLTFQSSLIVSAGYFAVGLIVLITVAILIWFRFVAAHSEPGDRVLDWITYRRRLQILILIGVPAWWSATINIAADRTLSFRLDKWVMLLVPSTGAIFIVQWITCWLDTKFLDQRWNTADLFRLAVWSTVSLPAPLLMVAAGMEAIRQGSLAGLFWEILAGTIALIGRLRLRAAEGFKPRIVKSGEFYKRSFAMAHKLGVRLQRVCVVPFGRGRLSNSYGGFGTVMVTDDYGHWLHGLELDFVIGHELAHVKHKHALKHLLAAPCVFGLMTVPAFVAPHPAQSWRMPLNLLLILIPVISLNLLSSYFEYAADRGGLEATQEPEACIRALTNVCRHAGLPPNRSRLEELFSTHPSFSRRIRAIAKQGRISAERLAELSELHEHSSRHSAATL